MRDYLPDVARGTQDPKADSLDATPKFVEHDTSRSRLHKGNLSAGWHRERVLDHGRRIGELSLQECIRAFQQWATDNYQQIAPVLPAFANGYLSQKVAKELANWSLAPDVPPNPHQDCGKNKLTDEQVAAPHDTLVGRLHRPATSAPHPRRRVHGFDPLEDDQFVSTPASSR